MPKDLVEHESLLRLVGDLEVEELKNEDHFFGDGVRYQFQLAAESLFDEVFLLLLLRQVGDDGIIHEHRHTLLLIVLRLGLHLLLVAGLFPGNVIVVLQEATSQRWLGLDSCG